MDETNTVNVARPTSNPTRMETIQTRQIGIEGMTCDQCVRKVESALRSQRGVKEVRVDRENAVATVMFDTSETDIPKLHDALLAAGYKPTRLSDADRADKPAM